MANVKWIKLTIDMFDNRKIRHLRRLPEGNSIVLIWVMLLTLAGRCNAGGMIFLTENIPYTTKMLADELGFEENTIKLALNALSQLGMIGMIDGNYIAITGWGKHQSIESMDKIREQTRKRVANYREKQKCIECNATSNVTVTQCNATEEEIEEDKEIEIDIDNNILSGKPTINDGEYGIIVEYLNGKVGTSYKPTSKKTQSLIRARLKEGFTVDDFKAVIDNQCTKWMGDSKMQDYLRPETLFGTKFESYLNARPVQSEHDRFMAELARLRNEGEG